MYMYMNVCIHVHACMCMCKFYVCGKYKECNEYMNEPIANSMNLFGISDLKKHCQVYAPADNNEIHNGSDYIVLCDKPCTV